MKIIDLLNKIANGEEVPEKIKFQNEIYEYNKGHKEYINQIDDYHSETLLYKVMQRHYIKEILESEVELIEDETIDIESIKYEELEILQEILGKSDLRKGNEEYILGVIKQNNNRLVNAVLKISKENETLTKAVKQLNKEIKELKSLDIETSEKEINEALKRVRNQKHGEEEKSK